MSEIPTHFLYPAALFADSRPHLISTVLGSCVAVCLYDPVMQVGGMNHYMLPLWNGQGLASPKYGNIAIVKLIEKMSLLGCRPRNLVAKIFGGANMFDTDLEQFQIGERNIKIAEEFIGNHKIRIAASSVGGNLGRKIQFYSLTGEVRQRLIAKSNV